MGLLRRFIVIGLLAGLGGCAGPTAQQIENADYGPYPDGYEAIAKRYMERTLKDPASAQYGTFTAPWRGYLSFMGATKFGYSTCVTYNAKNSYGAYTGFTQAYFLINNGSVIEFIDKADRVAAGMGIKLC
jgi:hypothetical protein